jgi:hypothetical protein
MLLRALAVLLLCAMCVYACVEKKTWELFSQRHEAATGANNLEATCARIGAVLGRSLQRAIPVLTSVVKGVSQGVVSGWRADI